MPSAVPKTVVVPMSSSSGVALTDQCWLARLCSYMIEASPIRYKRHRFPAEIITHAVWLYFRFPLSLRHVEDLLAERGIHISFQTVAKWAAKFGLKIAQQLRRRSRGYFVDRWQLDEIVVTVKGEKTDCGGPSMQTVSFLMPCCKTEETRQPP